MPKKWKPSPCDKVYGKFLDLDMFGEQLRFNMRGREHYETCCGVLFTMAILFVTVLYGYLSAMRAMRVHDIATVLTSVRPDYYETGRDFQIRQDSETDPFAFALTISSKNGF